MKRVRTVRAGVAVALLASVLALSAPAGAQAPGGGQPTYRYVQLPLLPQTNFPEDPDLRGQDLNNARRVVGTARDLSSEPVQWVDGQARRLGTGSGRIGGEALGVNEAGVAVGSAGSQAAVFRGGSLTTLPTGLSGRNATAEATAINGAGQIVGFRAAGELRPSEAVLWDDGEVIALGTLGGRTSPVSFDQLRSEAYDVNDRGQVVGIARGPRATYRGFIWEDGRMRDLGDLGREDSETVANAINERGQVVGTTPVAGIANSHAFRWQDGVMRDLGTLGGDGSDANDINEAGHVVGRSNPEPGVFFDHAFVWRNGRMIDLNDAVVGLPPGVVLESAEAINDDGVIVANSCITPGDFELCPEGDAPTRAYLLIPR